MFGNIEMFHGGWGQAEIIRDPLHAPQNVEHHDNEDLLTASETNSGETSTQKLRMGHAVLQQAPETAKKPPTLPSGVFLP